MNKLNKTLAIERAIKPGIYARFTEIHKASQRVGAMDGFEKTYQSVREDDTRKFPPESKKAEFSSKEMFDEVAKILTELFDITASKDWANCSAKGDVFVDGKPILTEVPAPYLLFLDKQLGDLMTFLTKIAELDPATEWVSDTATGLFKSKPIETVKTEKVQEPITLAPATDKHPAQVQLITKDVIVGHWTMIKYSGALTRTQKVKLRERTQKLINGVKGALEQANMVESPKSDVGSKVFGFLFEGI